MAMQVQRPEISCLNIVSKMKLWLWRNNATYMYSPHSTAYLCYMIHPIAGRQVLHTTP